MHQGTEPITPGTLLAGRYRVDRRLGEGGMGSVYLVEHVHTDQKLAVKILHSTVVRDAEALARFRREARTPARINSDHVVTVTDADVAPELGGVPFLVMEWLRGQDLGQISELRGALPPREALVYLTQAARALDKAHSMGIIHRDLKPENLFLTTREDGTPWVKLLDFGIAKLTGEAGGDLANIKSVTSTGQIFGTPLYMSPEQAKAEQAKISPMTDIWALGLIAHRLLTGTDFWRAETLTHLLAQIAYEPIPVPSSRGVTFGKAYDAWFLKCCAREASERYTSAGEAVAVLADALGIQDVSAAIASGRPSSPSLSGSGAFAKSGAPIAFAETAMGVSDQSLPPAPRSGASSVADTAFGLGAPARSSRGRLGIGLGTAGVLIAAGVVVWLVLGRANAGSDETTPTAGRIAAQSSSAEASSSVVVTPQPMTSTSAQPQVGASAAPTAPVVEVASARPADTQDKTGSRPPTSSGKPQTGGAPSSKPTAAPAVTEVKTAAPPAGDPENPLGTRH